MKYIVKVLTNSHLRGNLKLGHLAKKPTIATS